MSDLVPDARAPLPPEACASCARPPAVCVCDRTTPLSIQRRVLVLQHPREQDVVLGSARLLTASLARAQITVGLSWRSLAHALGEASAEPGRWGVIFPVREAQTKPADAELDEADLAAAAHDTGSTFDDIEVAEPQRTPPEAARKPQVRVIDRHGDPMEASRLVGIVALDGTWSQAKSLWWRNAWLLKLNRVSVVPKEPSIYGALRPEPRRDYVSTLEAVAQVLSACGEDAQIEASLRRVFRTMVQRGRDAGLGPLKRRRRAKRGR